MKFKMRAQRNNGSEFSRKKLMTKFLIKMKQK